MEEPNPKLFHQILCNLKNMEHLVESELVCIEQMNPEQKMRLIRTLNDVMIALKDIVLIDPIIPLDRI